MQPLLRVAQSPPKQYLYNIKSFATYAPGAFPDLWKASSAPKIHERALPGSLTRLHKKTWFPVSLLASPTWCEQSFVFQFLETKPKLTEQSRAGLEAHRHILNGTPDTPKGILDFWAIPWQSPEEEAAHIFPRMIADLKKLQIKGRSIEFKVLGLLNDRPLLGSIDAVNLKAGVVHIEELKTFAPKQTDTDEDVKFSDISKSSYDKAVLQASLYKYLLQRLLDRNQPFNFEEYFKARGLDPHKQFSKEFAHQLRIRLPKVFSKNDRHPNSLAKLGQYWPLHLKESDAPSQVADFLTILSAKTRTNVAGYRGATVKLTWVPYDESRMLRAAELALDLLDGYREPRGLQDEETAKCYGCLFQDRCRWYLKNTMVQELANEGAEISEIDASHEDLSNTTTPDILGISSANLFTGISKTPVVDPKGHIFVRSLLKRRRAREIEKIKIFREKLNESERVTMLARQKAQSEAAIRTTEMLRKEAEKDIRIKIALQRKVRPKTKQIGSETSVPKFLPPAVQAWGSEKTTISHLSVASARLLRRKMQLLVPSLVPEERMPRGVQRIPEDETYSIAKLKPAPSDGSKWVYQFDTLPSLKDEQDNLEAWEAHAGISRGTENPNSQDEEDSGAPEENGRRHRRKKVRGVADDPFTHWDA